MLQIMNELSKIYIHNGLLEMMTLFLSCKESEKCKFQKQMS